MSRDINANILTCSVLTAVSLSLSIAWLVFGNSSPWVTWIAGICTGSSAVLTIAWWKLAEVGARK